ncbi:MAG: hypothetical protein ABFC57_18010 [Veillonellales bacterium]
MIVTPLVLDSRPLHRAACAVRLTGWQALLVPVAGKYKTAFIR